MQYFGFRFAFEVDADSSSARTTVSCSSSRPPSSTRNFLTGPEAGERVTELQDFRPGEEFVTFRCNDPDGTEIEVF